MSNTKPHHLLRCSFFFYLILSFGLYHNGHGNTCSGRQYETSIMAAMVKANLQQYWWTDCSSKRMDEVLPFVS